MFVACAVVEIGWICVVAVLLLPFTFCVDYCGSMGVMVGVSGERWGVVVGERWGVMVGVSGERWGVMVGVSGE